MLSLLVSYGLPAATATPVASPSAPPLERRKDTIVGTKINLGGHEPCLVIKRQRNVAPSE